jgi:hypothetical protein
MTPIAYVKMRTASDLTSYFFISPYTPFPGYLKLSERVLWELPGVTIATKSI